MKGCGKGHLLMDGEEGGRNGDTLKWNIDLMLLFLPGLASIIDNWHTTAKAKVAKSIFMIWFIDQPRVNE